MPLHRLYGLTIDSEFAIPSPIAENGSPDVTVKWGAERPVPSDPPAGEILSNVSLGALDYSTTRTATGYLARFSNICDAVIDRDLAKVELVTASNDQRPLAELLFAGSVMAKILTLRGECVLHASAAAIDGGAVAYVGPPGRGKSTLAALTCAAGGRLITDDVLRLVPVDGDWMCLSGTGVVRLREQAESLAPLLGGVIERTQDQRVGVALAVRDMQYRITSLVFPLPSRTTSTVEVSRLTEQEALMRLTSFPRILGWKDPRVLAESFRWNARLARE
ncbi:MAG TPA: hypothetical protein VIG64_03040, partial [Actinomycetota bacterium]